MTEPIHQIKFPSGATVAMSRIGLGTAPLGNLYAAISEDQAQATLEAAWTQGIRYFDTAPLYGFGLAETRLNHFFRQHRGQDFTLSTKVGRLLRLAPVGQGAGIGKFFDTPSRHERFDYSEDGVLRSIEGSLERLGVDRIDIVFAHDLDIFTHGSAAARDHHVENFLAGGYRALCRLRDEEVIAGFGAGVNEWEVCESLARRGDFDVFLLAGRYTLLEQEPLESLLPLCVERGIKIVMGGALNSGILATGAIDGAFYNYAPAPPDILARVAQIEAICARHGTRMIDAALQFPLFHPATCSLAIGPSHPDHVARAVDSLAIPLPTALWGELKAAGLLRQDAYVTHSARGDGWGASAW